MHVTPSYNALGQPVGVPVENWAPPPFPPREAMEGRCCRLEPLDAERHAAPLFEAFSEDPSGRLWTYMAYGPFTSAGEYHAWVVEQSAQGDPLFFAVETLPEGKPVGVASYLRITPGSGSIEVGHLVFSPALQRTRAATEAMLLMMEQAFALGYRRCEWKCDALNAPSRAAAERLGFTFEGIFRQATVYKRRNRDTAWFSILDREWPALQAAFRTWLDPANFDPAGRQRTRLSDLTRAALCHVR